MDKGVVSPLIDDETAVSGEAVISRILIDQRAFATSMRVLHN